MTKDEANAYEALEISWRQRGETIKELVEALAELIDDALSANRPSQAKINRMRRLLEDAGEK